MNYNLGLDALRDLAQNTIWYQEFTLHESALRENLSDENRFGPSEQSRRDRVRIIYQLNGLSLRHLGISFNDLCLGKTLPSHKSSNPTSSTRSTSYAKLNRDKFRELMVSYFNEGEVRDLCFTLEIDYDDLSGIGKSDKVRELITYCERHGHVHKLLVVCQQKRPQVFDRVVID